MGKELRYKLSLQAWSKTTNHGLVKDVLKHELSLSDHEISQLKFDGAILLNGERVTVDQHMQVGDELVVQFKEDEPQEVVEPVDYVEPVILYEEEDFVVVNKEAGVPTHPSHEHLEDSMGTRLQVHYQKQGQNFVIRPIGRLDSDVSGIVIYAKSQAAASRLNQERSEGILTKTYVAFVEGHLDEKQGKIKLPLQKVEGEVAREVSEEGKEAISHYQVLEEKEIDGQKISVLGVAIETGRTHQIRAHLAAIGHPLCGDTLYGGHDTFITRPALHCAHAEFESPFSGNKVVCEAELPEDLKVFLRKKEGAETEVIPVVGPIVSQEEEELFPTQTIAKEEIEKGAEETKPETDWPTQQTEIITEEKKDVLTGETESKAFFTDSLVVDKLVGKHRDEDHKQALWKILLAVVLLLLIGFGGCIGCRNLQQGQSGLATSPSPSPTPELLTKEEIYETLNVVFDDVDEVEYESTFDVNSLVVSHTGEKIEVVKALDTKKLGKQRVMFRVTQKDPSGEEVTRLFSKEVTVRKESGPTIELNEESVSLQPNQTFDPQSNIKAVVGQTGKALMYVTELQNGTYIIESNVNASTPGHYVVTITAKDEAGKEEKVSYDVIVGGTPVETDAPINVKDTGAPHILIRKDNVDIQQGQQYNVADNVIYVRDNVDGNLTLSDTQSNGHYTIESNVDSNTPGVYQVKLIALDQAGNRGEDDWTVTVIAKQQETEPTPTPTPTPQPTETPQPEKEENETGSTNHSSNTADTTKPHILIRRDEVFVSLGSSYNPTQNIIHIQDETDGNLPYLDHEANGSYTIQHNIDVNTEGTYDVRLIATDNAGNKEYDDFKVTVKDASQIVSKTFDPGSNAEYIFNYITGTMGLNKAAAYGIMANMQRESGYSPYADNGMGYYGLCQWGGGRNSNLFSWCESNGLDPSSLDGQLAYMNMELNGSYSGCLNTLQNVSDSPEGAYEAGYAFGMYYEVAGEYHASSAGNLARNFFNNQ